MIDHFPNKFEMFLKRRKAQLEKAIKMNQEWAAKYIDTDPQKYDEAIEKIEMNKEKLDELCLAEKEYKNYVKR